MGRNLSLGISRLKLKQTRLLVEFEVTDAFHGANRHLLAAINESRKLRLNVRGKRTLDIWLLYLAQPWQIASLRFTREQKRFIWVSIGAGRDRSNFMANKKDGMISKAQDKVIETAEDAGVAGRALGGAVAGALLGALSGAASGLTKQKQASRSRQKTKSASAAKRKTRSRKTATKARTTARKAATKKRSPKRKTSTSVRRTTRKAATKKTKTKGARGGRRSSAASRRASSKTGRRSTTRD